MAEAMQDMETIEAMEPADLTNSTGTPGTTRRRQTANQGTRSKGVPVLRPGS